ncbi:MAG: hypothetical protein HYV07_23335, partial [Deltaproteobacteria bacterium]|nr:hypothetical protein [Deltaproteobacteria bacterium]
AREVVERSVSLVDTLGELELRERLLRSILDVLDERMIEVLKQMVMNPTNPATENPALRRLVDEFAARFGPELKAEGRAEGRAEGKAEGRAEGKAEDIVRVLVARGVVLEESARIRVLACRDLALLDRWFDQALTLAPSAVFDPDA